MSATTRFIPSPLRGSDTSAVDDQCFVALCTKVSPRLLRRLDNAAAKRNLTRAEMLRDMIRGLEGEA